MHIHSWPATLHSYDLLLSWSRPGHSFGAWNLFPMGLDSINEHKKKTIWLKEGTLWKL